MAQISASFDWGVPYSAEFSISLRTWVNSLNLNLSGKDQLPARLVIQDAPVGPVPPITLRTWTQGFFTTGTTVVQRPFFQTNWLNPRGSIRSVDLLTFTENLTYTFNKGTLPFRQRDWPNPQRAPIRVVDLLTFTENLTYLINKGTLPFSQSNWPVTPGRIPFIDLRTFTENLTYTFNKGTLPFRQRDWPNPRGATPFTKDWSDPTNIQLINRGTLPFSQSDWPVPRGAIPAIDLRTWLQGFFTEATQLPFNQFDWPDPRSALPAITLKTWIDQTKLLLQGQDTFFGLAGSPNFDWPNPRGATPFTKDWIQGFQAAYQVVQNPFPNNNDWPNPRGSVPVIDLRTWTENTTYLIGQDTFFGLAGHPNFDWPNPRGPIGAIDLRTWIQGFFTTGSFVQNPFIPIDWANPRGATPAIDLRTWIQGFFATGTIVQLPFNQFGWPVPRGPVGVIDLRTWTENLTYLIGKDTFFGLAGNPTFNWPNPRGATPFTKDWFDQTKIKLVGKDKLPFRQGDWPDPRGATPSILLKTIGNDGTIYLNQDTFFGLAGHPNFNWPNPWGAIPNITLKTFWTPYNPNVYPPPTPPAVTEIHFRPFINTCGMLGSLG